MSQYMGLNPTGAHALSRVFRQTATDMDDVSDVLAHAFTSSGLSVPLAPLWELQSQLFPTATRISSASDLMVMPLEMDWLKPTAITGTDPFIMNLAQMLQCRADGGDPGGYLTQRPLAPLVIGDFEITAARSLTAAALGYLHGPNALAPDEFGVVKLDDNHIVVALPGVMDLTTWVKPWCALGYDNHHESLRDVDQEALGSWPDADLSQNGYAEAVKEWFERAIDAGEVAPGARVALIGHSFGSDTAFDLAASPEFNGELVNVDVLVGAGYDNEPYFDKIPESTAVLSLRNRKDIPALVEEKGRGLFGDVWNMAKTAVSSPTEAAKAVATTALVTGVELFGTLPSVVTARSPTVTEVAIDGGWKGAGHDPDNYIDYLESQEAGPALEDFWTMMAAAGFATGGTAMAIDVSRRTKNGRTNTPASVGGPRGTTAEEETEDDEN